MAPGPRPAIAAALDASVRLLESGPPRGRRRSRRGVVGRPQANAGIWCANLVPWIDALAQESAGAPCRWTLWKRRPWPATGTGAARTVSAVDISSPPSTCATRSRAALAVFGQYDAAADAHLAGCRGRWDARRMRKDSTAWVGRRACSNTRPAGQRGGACRPRCPCPLASNDGLPTRANSWPAKAMPRDGVLLRLAGQLEQKRRWGSVAHPWAGTKQRDYRAARRAAPRFSIPNEIAPQPVVEGQHDHVADRLDHGQQAAEGHGSRGPVHDGAGTKYRCIAS